MRKISIITRFLVSCAGCDIATLKQCSSAEVRKMAIIGSCVLITPLLGIASGTFAMLTFSNNLKISIGFGLLWGSVIFLIERAVVSNTRPGEFNLGVLARMLLACIFAVVISVPLELWIFKDAIHEKLSNNLRLDVNKINNDYDSKIAIVNADVVKEKEKVDYLKNNFSVEIDGTGGSGKRGKSTIANEKEKLYKDEEEFYNKYASDKQQEIDDLNDKRQVQITDASKSQAQGFLGEMRALGELGDEDKTVWWGMWLIRLFFFSVELTPILIKLSSGKKDSAYYPIVVQSADMAVNVNRQMEEVRAEEMVKQQRAMVNKDLLELQFAEEQAIMNDAQKRFDFYMAQLKRASDRKLVMQQYVFTTVKDEQLRSQLLEQIEQIYEDFQRTLQSLVNRQKPGSNFINNLS